MRLTGRLRTAVALAVLCSLAGCGGGSASAASASASAAPAGTPSTGPANGTYTAAGNASTVQGVDSENRGYRDDVAQLIEDKYSSATPAVKTAAVIAAKVYQTSISSTTLAMDDTSPVLLAGAQLNRCNAETINSVDVLAAAADALHAVYARTFNTDARMAARQLYLSKAKSVGAIEFDPAKCGASAQ